MPRQTNITVKDGKATPLDRAFAALGVSQGIATWAENSADGSLSKRALLEFTQKNPGRNRKTAAGQLHLSVPHVVSRTIDGVPQQVVHSNVRLEVRVISDPDVPVSVIRDVFAMGRNALSDDVIEGAFIDRDGVN